MMMKRSIASNAFLLFAATFGAVLIFAPEALAAQPTTLSELTGHVCGLSICGGVKRASDGKISNPTISAVTCSTNSTKVSYAGIEATLNPSASITCFNSTRVCLVGSVLDTMNQLAVGFTSTDFTTPQLVTVTFNGTSAAGTTSTTTCLASTSGALSDTFSFFMGMLAFIVGSYLL